MNKENKINERISWIEVVILMWRFKLRMYMKMWVSWEKKIIEKEKDVKMEIGEVIYIVLGIWRRGKKEYYGYR